MHSTATPQMQALGEAREPCAGCGTPLAADQRYCLNCGQRRAGPRVDFRRYLLPSAGEGAPPESPQAPPATVPPSEPPEPGRDYAPLAAVGGIAVLGLMLLVGVLIGKGSDSTAPAPAPILKVNEGAAPSTASTESGGSKTASTKSSGSSNKPKESGTSAKSVAGGLTGEAASKSKGTVQASKGDLESLNSQSGDSYQEAVKKLPDKIATPGAPPPVDKSKPPGDGGGAVTIE
ncbi:MAG TPA: hypothetical protein VIE64_01815 [Solirubrobacterales bacterium]